ncbi:hypothetical protein B0T19DRAFT_418994 [Cercophora scortea]|uniref:Transmembrane protein n=1 Tax=Cercophora scortea TaxID=314031 RepID=A0AAE0IYR9_9PEZI|nr:hypothetical protein B0T19DRAFT_418994 [Cercophora scortea]
MHVFVAPYSASCVRVYFSARFSGFSGRLTLYLSFLVRSVPCGRADKRARRRRRRRKGEAIQICYLFILSVSLFLSLFRST